MRHRFIIATAKISDCLDIFSLSNDVVVREVSFSSNKIKLEDHISWFEKKITDKNVVFYVIRTTESDFVGYVRFDENLSKDCYVITIHLHKIFRGKGLGTFFIQEATQMFLCLKPRNSVQAFVKKNNMASYKSFLNAGYSLLAETVYIGSPCFILIVNRNFYVKKNTCSCCTSR